MKALVAGFGNIFFGDDGFGCEVARRLTAETLPEGVRAVDFGIRGMHVAFEMLDGYELTILVDAVRRGNAPGTLYVIEPGDVPETMPDGHAMELHNALALYERLAARLSPSVRPVTTIVGCEPETLTERIGLSAAVASSVEPGMALVRRLLAQNGIGVESYEAR